MPGRSKSCRHFATDMKKSDPKILRTFLRAMDNEEHVKNVVFQRLDTAPDFPTYRCTCMFTLLLNGFFLDACMYTCRVLGLDGLSPYMSYY